MLGLLSVLGVVLILVRNCVIIWKASSSIRKVITFIVIAPFLFIALSALLIITPLAKLVKNAIDLTLQIKLGDEYGGIIGGLDVSFCALPKTSFIKTLLIVEYNKKLGTANSVNFILETLKQKFSSLPDRFFTTLDEFMGYAYLKKVKLLLDDVVKKMPLSEEVLDKAQLLRAIERCCSESLPLNGMALWDVHVGTEPLRWRTNSDANIEYYPIFVRFHHVLGDGISLMKIIMTVLGGDDALIVIRHKRTLMRNAFSFLNTLILFPSAFYSSLFLKSYDTNEIHQIIPPDTDVLQFDTDENGEIFQKLKMIRKISGATIPEIIITAFTASLNDYFENHCSTIPDFVAVAVLVSLDYADTGKITKNNNFISVTLNAPLDVSQHRNFKQSMPLISRLNIIRVLSQDLKNSGEYQVLLANQLSSTSLKQNFQFNLFFLHHFIGSLPPWVFLKILGRISMTSVVTLLPGPKRLSFCDGVLTVSDCVFWPPYVVPIGISLSSLTFEDRLQMVINCKCRIESSGASELLNGVYKYIGLIEQEITLKMK